MKIIWFIITIPIYLVIIFIKLIINIFFSFFPHRNKKYNTFYKEAKLYNLSKEDRIIAKSERMSPSDYIEAEERDDDNLDSDD